MNGITAARRQLVDYLGAHVAELELELEAGVTVVDHVPEELVPPTLVVDEADEYLTRGDSYGPEWWLTLRVYVLVDLAANLEATEELEAVLAVVLSALASSEWEVEPVGRPEEFHTMTWLAHGVPITVRKLIHLNTQE